MSHRSLLLSFFPYYFLRYCWLPNMLSNYCPSRFHCVSNRTMLLKAHRATARSASLRTGALGVITITMMEVSSVHLTTGRAIVARTLIKICSKTSKSKFWPLMYTYVCSITSGQSNSTLESTLQVQGSHSKISTRD